MHQTERDQEATRLGRIKSQASSRVPRPQREHSRPAGRIRLQETVPKIPQKVKYK